MLSILLTCGLAFAQPVLVRVRAVDPTLAPPVAIQVGAVQALLRDDGGAPDPQAGDGIWGAVLPGGPAQQPQLLTLSDARGRSWSISIEWPENEPAELDLVLDGDKGLALSRAPIQAPVELPGSAQALPALGGSSAATEGSAAFSWAIAALGWGLALSMGLARFRRRPRALTELTSPLADHRFVVSPDALPERLQSLCLQHRLLMVGDIGALPAQAFAFAPDGPEPADVASALRTLQGRGRPMLVVIAAPCASDPAALSALLAACKGVPVLIAAEGDLPGARPLPSLA